MMTIDETFDVGLDTRTGVDDSYELPFRFTGHNRQADLQTRAVADDGGGSAGCGGSSRQGDGLDVNAMNLSPLSKILAFAAVMEAGTGLVLMADPTIVVALLLGVDVSGVGTVLGRTFGIALLALGLACWPGPQRADRGLTPFLAMLTYNGLVALYLAYLGTVWHLGGLLLWPGVALHAGVALLLLWTWRVGRRT